MTNEFSKYSPFLACHVAILCIEKSSFLACHLTILFTRSSTFIAWHVSLSDLERQGRRRLASLFKELEEPTCLRISAPR